jgi:hypothetical protein
LTATDVEIAGNYAYVTARTANKLTVVDISTPTAPVYVASVTHASLSGAASLEISGNYIYTANANNPGGVTTINITNPLAPTYQASTGSGSYIPYHIHRAGTAVYLVGAEFISIYGLANPAAPNFLTRLYDNGSTAFLSSLAPDSTGNYLFGVGSSTNRPNARIEVFNMTIKSLPTSATTLVDATNMTTPNDVFYSSDYLYVADGGKNALVIYDVSAPTAPVFAGTYIQASYLGDVQAVKVVGNYAYLAACGGDRFTIVDVTNKAAPVLASSVSDALLNCPIGVDVVGNYAYVASLSADSLTIFDVTNKSSPVLVGSIVDSVKLNNIRSVRLVGSLLYATTNTSYISTIDVSNPTAPVFVAVGSDYSYSVTGLNLYGGTVLTQTTFGQPVQVQADATLTPVTLNTQYECLPSSASAGAAGSVIGDYFVTVAKVSAGLCVYPLTTPNVAYSTAKYFNDSHLLDTANFLAASGNSVFMATAGGRITVVDVSTPLSPTILNSQYFSELGIISGIAIQGNYAFVGSENSKFGIIDISNPSAMVFKGFGDVNSGPVTDITIAGNYVYTLRQGSDRVRIIDVSSPLAPVNIGTYLNASFNWLADIFVLGNYAYVVDGSNSLFVLDVTVKATPTLLTTLTDATNLGAAVAVTASGSYAYVGTSTRLTIVDVSNPAAPVVVGSALQPAQLSGVKKIVVSGNYAYVASNGGALTIVDISNPATPSILSNYDQGVVTTGRDLLRSGNYIYFVEGHEFDVFKAEPLLQNGACTTPAQMGYSTVDSVLQFCNGSFWHPVSAIPGAGGAGCSSPTGKPGGLDYNSVGNKYRFCDGSAWINID